MNPCWKVFFFMFTQPWRLKRIHFTTKAHNDLFLSRPFQFWNRIFTTNAKSYCDCCCSCIKTIRLGIFPIPKVNCPPLPLALRNTLPSLPVRSAHNFYMGSTGATDVNNLHNAFELKITINPPPSPSRPPRLRPHNNCPLESCTWPNCRRHSIATNVAKFMKKKKRKYRMTVVCLLFLRVPDRCRAGGDFLVCRRKNPRPLSSAPSFENRFLPNTPPSAVKDSITR